MIEKMRTRLKISPLEFTVALIFGGLVVSMFALGGNPTSITVMFIVAAAEIYAFAELRQPNLEPSRAGGWLRAAALLTILATALFLIPVVLTGHVKSCFDCSNLSDEIYYDDSYNYFGTFALMWTAGIAAGVGALISWGISLVRLYGRAAVTRF